MLRKLQRLSIAVIAVVMLIVAVPSYAQNVDCEQLDFASLAALLAEAQGKASSGDKEGALKLAEQVQAELAEMNEQCAKLITEIVLSKDYDDPVFSFSYPDDFFASNEQEMLFSTEPDFSFTALVNNPKVIDALSRNTILPSGAQFLTVGVGHAASMARSIGAFSETVDYRDLNASELAQLVANANSPTIRFDEIETLAINDKDAALVAFRVVSGNEKPTADAYLLIVRLASDRVGVVALVTAPEEGETVKGLITAIAATLKLK